MRVLIVEDDPGIKTDNIDDCLASLGHESDWAKNQQEANGLVAANDYDLVLHDLQIPARPGGKDMPEFGKNSLRQIRARKGRDLPVILMTGQHQHCVDMISDLQDIGIDGSISKPFPRTGRTLAAVIEEVMAKTRQRRAVSGNGSQPREVRPFSGGVLAFHARHIDLCDEAIVQKNHKGYAWRILHLLREKNTRGRFVRMGSASLAAKLHPSLAQNTLSQSIKALRERITEVMYDRLDLDCGQFDVIDNRGKGYHLRDWIAVEVYDEAGVLVGTAQPSASDSGGGTAGGFSERQRWILAQLAGDIKLTRRQVESHFGISPRTAKRELNGLVEAGMISYDRTEPPGHYVLCA